MVGHPFAPRSFRPNFFDNNILGPSRKVYWRDFPIRKLLLGQMLRKLVGGELQELPPVMGGQLDAEQGVG
jgi:hypothetical protein